MMVTYLLSSTGLLQFPSHISPYIVDYLLLLLTTALGVAAGFCVYKSHKWSIPLLIVCLALAAAQSGVFIAHRDIIEYESAISFFQFYLTNLSAVSFNHEIVLPVALIIILAMQLTNHSAKDAPNGRAC